MVGDGHCCARLLKLFFQVFVCTNRSSPFDAGTKGHRKGEHVERIVYADFDYSFSLLTTE